MRIRTFVLVGAAAAAIGYLLAPGEGKARRERLRAALGSLAALRSRTVDRSTPLPTNVAPRVMQPEAPALTQRPASTRSPVPGAPPAVTEVPAGAGTAPGPEPAPDVPREPITDGDDANIVTRVTATLRGRRDLHADDLVIDVVNGTAYLSGDLQDPHTFGEIVDVTRSVPGVRRVQSLLHLPDSEIVSRTISAHRVGDDRRPGR